MAPPRPVRLITDTERRARLARRHRLSPDGTTATAEDVAAALVGIHATEPATPFLALRARIPGFARAALDHSLTGTRTLVRQLAMRRTVFLVHRADLDDVLGGPSARVAAQQLSPLRRILRESVTDDPDGWLKSARTALLAHLEDGREAGAQELRSDLDELRGTITMHPDKSYGGVGHVAPRVLTWLGAAGDLVRGGNAGSWRTSRHRWARMDRWLDPAPVPAPPGEAMTRLIGRYIATHGPVTETDIVWFFGTTRGIVRTAIAALGAVAVGLERDGIGWVLPEDLEPVATPEPWIALLPALDPASMAYKERDFYLDPRIAPDIVDRTGNIGTTIWCDGRIIGAYTLDADARPRALLSEDVPVAVRSGVAAAAAELGDWLAGERVTAVYKSPITLADQPV